MLSVVFSVRLVTLVTLPTTDALWVGVMGSSQSTRGRLEGTGCVGVVAPWGRCVGGAWAGAGAKRRPQRRFRGSQSRAAMR